MELLLASPLEQPTTKQAPGRRAGGADRQARANEPQLAAAFLFPVRRVSYGTCECAGPQSPAGPSLRDTQGLPTSWLAILPLTS